MEKTLLTLDPSLMDGYSEPAEIFQFFDSLKYENSDKPVVTSMVESDELSISYVGDGPTIGYGIVLIAPPEGFFYSDSFAFQLLAQNHEDSYSTNWSRQISCLPDETVDFLVRLNFYNDGIANNDIIVKNVFPEQLVYVNGSTKMYIFSKSEKDKEPTVLSLEDSITETNGLNLGSHTSDDHIYLVFSAKVDKTADFVDAEYGNFVRTFVNGEIDNSFVLLEIAP
jgi:hypothetical protein